MQAPAFATSLLPAIVAALALAAAPSHAAGGAHIIDDAAIEPPGHCHLDGWYNHFTNGYGLIQVSPACTPAALPRAELGGFVRHAWTNSFAATGIGLAAKFALRDEATGLGIALSPSVDYDLDINRIATASVIVPLTLPITATLRVNINAGWQWVYLDDIHAGFAGAQLDWQFAPGLTAMIEGFGRTVGKPGGQAGVRWTVAKGSIDIDFLAGRYLDGFTPTALTIGVTVRR